MTPPPPPPRNPQEGGSQGRKGPRHRDASRASSAGDQRPGSRPGGRRTFNDGPRKRRDDGPGAERWDKRRPSPRQQDDRWGRPRPQRTNDGDRPYGSPARQNWGDRPRGRDRDRDQPREQFRDRRRPRDGDARPGRRQDRFEQRQPIRGGQRERYRENDWQSDPDPIAGDSFRHQPDAAAVADDLVWGRHAAEAALNGERPIHRIWCTPELRFNTRFMQPLREARSAGVVVEEVTWARLAQLCNGAVHQGIVLQVAAAETIQLDTLVAQCDQCGEPPLLVAVDGITDPHNLGAIVRTAEAFAAQGMVIPQRRNAGLTGSVAKVAAGALEHLPVARVVNLNRSLEQLKQAGYTVIGLAEDGGMSIAEVPARDPLVVVTGSEGSGLSLMTRKHCDHLVRIPLRGETPSLNGSVASGVVLYEIARQRWLGKLSGTMPAPPRPLKRVVAAPPQTATGETDRLAEAPSAASASPLEDLEEQAAGEDQRRDDQPTDIASAEPGDTSPGAVPDTSPDPSPDTAPGHFPDTLPEASLDDTPRTFPKHSLETSLPQAPDVAETAAAVAAAAPPSPSRPLKRVAAAPPQTATGETDRLAEAPSAASASPLEDPEEQAAGEDQRRDDQPTDIASAEPGDTSPDAVPDTSPDTAPGHFPDTLPEASLDDTPRTFPKHSLETSLPQAPDVVETAAAATAAPPPSLPPVTMSLSQAPLDAPPVVALTADEPGRGQGAIVFDDHICL